MRKVDAWVLARGQRPRKGGVTTTGVFMLLAGGKRFTPVFSSRERLDQFAHVLHAAGYDMRRYQRAFATGMEDEDDLVWDLDPHEVVGRILGDIR
mgnify:CR=1 FL=1